jgi:hypothetical protein
LLESFIIQTQHISFINYLLIRLKLKHELFFYFQVSFSVCAATAKQANQTVVYIDTGAVFSASRVLQMIPNNSSIKV